LIVDTTSVIFQTFVFQPFVLEFFYSRSLDLKLLVMHYSYRSKHHHNGLRLLWPLIYNALGYSS